MTVFATDMRLPMTARQRADPARAGTTSAGRAPQSVPDALLVARVLGEDDRHAFAELVRRHQSGVRAVLRRLTRGNQALADDLGQETFLQVYRNLRQFRGEARLSTWIYRVAYNRFLAHVRALHPEEELPDDLPATAVNDPGDTGILKLDLERALARLSVAERAAIVHCYYHDLSHEEAAYVLGCPLGTVKTNILRGRQKLRALLAGWEPHEEAKR